MTATDKEKEILDFINNFDGDPSITDIYKGLDLHSTSHAEYFVKNLTNKGLVRYYPKSPSRVEVIK